MIREPTPPGGSRPLSLYGEELAPGARVGGFSVEEVWHRGVVAVLYRARDERSGAPVALKVMRPQYASSESALRRFDQECRMLEQLAHPNLVRVLESGELRDGRPWLAMEWLEGRDLEAELAARGPFPPREALRMLEPVASALGAAHALGIVHRDIKAQNVMVRPGEGGAPHVTLVDFGIAKLLDPGQRSISLTTTGVTVGTPVAMAPEQILRGPVDARTDLYGLGVLLYQLLTGRLPFRASSQAELEELHLHAPPPAPSHMAPVPGALDAVVKRCLAKRPEDRYPDTAALMEDLRRAIEPSAPPAGRTRGLGLYLCARPKAGEDADDATLDALDRVLDSARDGLTRRGLALMVEGADFLLAATPLPPDAPAARARRQEVLEALGMLWPELERLAAGANLHLEAMLHVAEAVVEPGLSGEPRVVDGPLLREGKWTAGVGRAGVFATHEVLEGLAPGLAEPVRA
ncbi:serine/threonine-protein kinase [Vitiosangium sp. GDMCC 1.1324]|uniref:serine/threonine-protein kinase n=1 Tax=Vitiosangium sp. (strain GDMCC 1.1324) TaxID=2138576 RepID=UPI000D35672C|nr:serine/threonine-protein kinase [Vitiosangium sp. GDMCC 1.1324]PTL84571.1 serine/threonine protein kinase [Vitiosangium sp. GDMCC 1.1324]